MSDAPPQGRDLVDPPLPFDMRPRIRRAVADLSLHQLVDRATHRRDRRRVAARAEAFGDRYDEMRDLAGAVRQHALDHLDQHLDRFVDRALQAGARVHFAADAEEARAICTSIAAARECRRCVKSKSMVTEEIDLAAALEAAGLEVVETDLGEFIVQLDGDAPAHIVGPIINRDRTAVAATLRRELGVTCGDDPEELTRIVRRHLRERYRRADLGVSGANFLVAETGTVVLCTNEGNADLVTAGPPVHVVVAGIEKIVPGPRELTVLLKLLARSATAQDLTVYTTLITGPRRAADHDGPDELHIVLLDNGRSGLLRPETRELLRCIRCGACLNTCPVYRTVGGGHAYGAVYSGPIGAVLTPHLKGIENYRDLPQVSSLCGACRDACPVAIDIPAHLLHLRAELVRARATGRATRLAFRAWTRCLRHPRLYVVAARVLRRMLRPLDRRGTTRRRWRRRLPGPLAAWTRYRDFPAPARQSFRAWWTQRERGGSP